MKKDKDIEINIDVRNKLNALKTSIKNNAKSISKTGEIAPVNPLFLFEEPVSPKTFIESPEYFDNKNKKLIFPWIIEDLEEIFSGPYHSAKYQTVVTLCGTGSGKAYMAAFIDAYLIYWLKSFRSLHDYFLTKNVNWDDHATLSFINMAPSKEQAKHIVFERIKQIINGTKVFRDRNWLSDPNITTSMQFKEKDEKTNEEFTKIAIVPGNSSSTMMLGFGIFGGIIDEANFYKEKNVDPVIQLFEQMNERRMSRFGNEGLIVLISSANSDNDLTEQLGSKSEKDPTIFFRRRSRYDCKPEFFFMPRFTLEVKKEKMDGTIETIILHPPEVLRPLYEANKDRALRDIDALPSLAGTPFYQDFMLVLSKVNKERIDPCPDLGLDKPEDPSSVFTRLPSTFRGIPEATYRVHVDLAKGSVVRGQCGCGFSMTHKIADINFGFKVKLDLAVRFKSPAGKEILVNDVLDLIKALIEQRGFNIDLVTFDQWNSLQAIQIINNNWKLNTRAQELAVGYKEHKFLRDCIVGGQFDFYEDQNLLFELKRLEDYGESIDHAIGSFKDEADAVAGAVYSASGALDSINKKEIIKPRARTGFISGSGMKQFVKSQPGVYKNDFIPKYRK